MYSVWLSLKESVNCSAKFRDVFRPERSKGRNRTVSKVTPSKELPSTRGNQAKSAIFGHKHGRERFKELSNGDTARNIVEMIFHASSTRQDQKHPMKIDRVLKVKNTHETLKRFEAYREVVKKRARGEGKLHPRSVVDGNELLMFHTTTMSCCPRQKSTKVSELCLAPTCNVCRIIQSGFEINSVADQITMSASCDACNGCNGSAALGWKGDHGKSWAVVVCRVIAGRMVDMINGGGEEGFDSVGVGGLDGKLDLLSLRDPSAVLPCFVIICAW